MTKMNTLTIIGLALIFFGGIGGILLAVGQSISSQKDKTDIIDSTKKENRELKIQINELKEERTKLNEDLKIRDNRIQEQNNNIVSLSNKLVEKSDYIQEFISGENRYPIVDMMRIRGLDGKEDQFSFAIRNLFEYPIYNIAIQSFDFEKIAASKYSIPGETKEAISRENFDNAIVFEYNQDEIPKGEYRMLPETYPMQSGSNLIKIHSRSQRVIQKIVRIKLANNLYTGYVVINPSGEVLKEYYYNNPSPEILTMIKEGFNRIPNDFEYLISN